MDKQPDSPQPQEEPPGPEGEPPPFDPDPRIVTYLERGASNDAEQRFREVIRKRRDGR